MNGNELAKNTLNRKPTPEKTPEPKVVPDKGMTDYINHLERSIQENSQTAEMLKRKITELETEIREKNSVIISQALDLESNRRSIAYQGDVLKRIEILTNPDAEDFNSLNKVANIVNRIHMMLVGR